MTSVTSLTRALEKAEAAQNWTEVSINCNKIGHRLASEGRNEEALEYYLRDEEVCSKMGDSRGLALAHRKLGEVLLELGKYEEALAHSKANLSISHELQNPVTEQEALVTMGRTYLYMGEHDSKHLVSARDFFTKSLDAAGRISTKDLESRCQREAMIGRAHQNLSYVYWQLEDKEKFRHHLESAERVLSTSGAKLCRDLHRFYDQCASLMLESKNPNDMELALKYALKSLDAAKNISGPDHETRPCMVSAYYSIAKAHLIYEGFEDAKKQMYKAYHGSKSTVFKDALENNLKMVIVIVKARNSISKKVKDDNLVDDETHLHFEHIADALCKFDGSKAEKTKVLAMAVKYYNQAYSRATNEGSSSLLPALNNSIAMTYKDMEDYDQALFYYEKQLKMEMNSPKDQCVTLSNLAIVKEYLGFSPNKVLEDMNKWLMVAQSCNSKAQQIMALLEIIRVQEAEKLEIEVKKSKQILEELKDGDEMEPSSQSSGLGLDSEPFPDIDIDEEVANVDVLINKSRRNVYNQNIKTNNKGESELQVKVQRGKKGEVMYLLDKGYPLEHEDFSGMTALLDSVENTNLSVVKILAQYGANLDHKSCEWVTPLISACQKGWLEGIDFLFKEGADVFLKDKQGNSGLSYLRGHLLDGQEGHSPEEYTKEVITWLKDLIIGFEEKYREMGMILDKKISRPSLLFDDGDEEQQTPRSRDQSKRATKEINENTNFSSQVSSKDEGNIISSTQKARKQHEHRSQNAERLISSTQNTNKRDKLDRRRSMSRSRSPSLSPVRSHIPTSSHSLETPTETYRKTMESIRGSGTLKTSGSKETSKTLGSVTSKTPGLGPRSVLQQINRQGGGSSTQQLEIDNWLIDDVGENKRKRPSDEGRESKKIKPSVDKRLSSNIPKLDLTEDIERCFERSSSPNLVQRKSSKLTRTSLQPKIDRVLTTRTPSPIQCPPSPPPPAPSVPLQTGGPVARVRVKVNDKVLLIPVPRSDLTVDWLAKESATRYYRSEGSEPVLSLCTGDGARLDRGDLVTDVVTGSEPLVANITSWNCKPAQERYQDACRDMNSACFKNIKEKMQLVETTNALDLSVPLKKVHIEPICHTIKSCLRLRDLNLSNCKLTDNSFSVIVSVLPTLPSLSSMNVSTNCLTLESIHLLASVMPLPTPSLLSLNLSWNPLGDLSLPSITKIVSTSKLNTLKLTGCFFTKTLFQSGRQEFTTGLKDSKLKTFHIAHNNLCSVGLEILLKCLPSSNLTDLDLSSCESESGGYLTQSLATYCRLGNPDTDLTTLSMSNLRLDDSQVPDLCSALYHCGRLTYLDLSRNLLTVHSMIIILKAVETHNVPLITLLCQGSDSTKFWQEGKILEESLEHVLDSVLSTCSEKLEMLSLPQGDEVTSVSKVWNTHWGTRSRHCRDGMGNMVWTLKS